MSAPSSVGIVGAGLIGRAWALLFARAGWRVRVSDPSAAVREAAMERLAEEADILVRHGLCEDLDGTLARIDVATSLAEAVHDARFVQENGPEDVEVKRAIFAELDAAAPTDAVLASSTSAIVASRFTAELAGRARCLVGHPVNPPHLVPLVEICPSEWTDPAVVARARAVYRAIGQVPVEVRREVDGFVLNRLQGALLGEAFRLVRDGVVSAEDLDHVVKDGLGTRWSFMGPFETIDLNAPGGLADYLARYGGFYGSLAADPPAPEVFGLAAAATLVEAWPHAPEPARLAALTRWRNERLAALVAHKAAREAAREAAPEPAPEPTRDGADEDVAHCASDRQRPSS